MGMKRGLAMKKMRSLKRTRTTYSFVITSPPDSSFTSTQNSREESVVFQMLLLTIFVLSISIATVTVSKVGVVWDAVVLDAVAVPTSVMASVPVQSPAYRDTVAAFPVPISYDMVTSLVESDVKSTAASS